MAADGLVVGGWHAVSSALEHAPGDCLELWLRAGLDSAEAQAVQRRAAPLGLAVRAAEGSTLERIYGDSHHQGVVLRRRAPAPQTLDDVLARAGTAARPPLLLVLDSVQDPRNFGACLRVADGAGADGVIFARDKSARLGNVVAKAASGAIDTVALVAVANLARALKALQAAGVWITGTAADADESLYAVDFRAASALVLGNEGSGLRRLTAARCDRLVSIPMAGQLASLNVASAAAVCLFEARRQRLAGAAGT